MAPKFTLTDLHSADDALHLPLRRARLEKGSELTDAERARVMRGERWDGKTNNP